MITFVAITEIKKDGMNWIILIIAGLCEVAFTYCLGRTKSVQGMEWWTWITAFGFFYVLSALLLAKATQTLPIGTAYPVWTGIGAVGAVWVGIFVFREPATFWLRFPPRDYQSRDSSLFSDDAYCVNYRT